MFMRCGALDFHVRVDGPSEAPAVVLLHAIGTSLHVWDGVAAILASGHRTVQIDLRGHGLSAVPSGPYTLGDMADDVDAIIAELGIRTVHLVGISLGGAVALGLAGRQPAYLRSLVLCDTDTAFPPSAQWHERARLARSEGLAALIEPALARWVSPAAAGGSIGYGLRAMLQRTDPEGYAGAAEALAACDLTSAAASLDLPTLIMVGERDPSTPVARAVALRDAIAGATMCILPGLAHLPPAEAPVDVAGAIEAFLRALPDQTLRGQPSASTTAPDSAVVHDARNARIDAAGAAACERLLHAWMDALNRHDAAGMNACLRFPHVRVAAGDVVVLSEPDDGAWRLFQGLIDSEGWHHSAWTKIELVQSSPSKAHYAVQYTRYRADDTIIGVYDSLYVFTLADGAWMLQARSSFGP